MGPAERLVRAGLGQRPGGSAEATEGVVPLGRVSRCSKGTLPAADRWGAFRLLADVGVDTSGRAYPLGGSPFPSTRPENVPVEDAIRRICMTLADGVLRTERWKGQ